MNWEGIVEALLGSGPFGIICAVLLWRDWKRDEREVEREIRREAIEKERIEADKALAVSMSLLTERVK